MRIIEVNYANLGLAQQVLVRQHDSSVAVKQHLTTYGTLDQSDMGLILQLLLPINDALLNVGGRALDLSATVFEEGGKRMGETLDTYLEAERRAAERNAEVAQRLGASVPPYTPPTIPTLGAASNSAPSHYGDPEGDLFNQAFWDGYGAAEWGDDVTSQARDRVTAGLTAHPTVSESVDVRSFLPVPKADDPELENIRWKAGVIFGAVDWVWEKLFHYSLLEKITQPFTGNWTSMKEAALAWTHTSDALKALSQNAAGLLPGTASWTGKGSEAFVVAAAAVSQGHQVLSGPAATVSSMLKALATVAKFAAGMILKILRKIQDRLLMIAAEAAVPLVGWAAALITTGISAVDLAQDALKAYKYVNIVYDAVSGMVSGIADIADSAFRMADLPEGLARGVAARG